MNFWTDSLYDAGSLVVLARFLGRGGGGTFASAWGLDECLSATWMCQRLAGRLRATIRLCDLPPAADLRRILSAARLSSSVARVDELVYAAAIYHNHRVVTAEAGLTEVLTRAGVRVRSPAHPSSPFVVPPFVEPPRKGGPVGQGGTSSITVRVGRK